MIFLKQNWFKISILVILYMGFYWFSYRPSQIRSRCLAEAEFDQRAIKGFEDEKRNDFINDYYKTCVKRFGIEK